MQANELAIGRNHYTADSAKLVTFTDCARAELHWNDGALVYELFDERDGVDFKQVAVSYLLDHGFSAA